MNWITTLERGEIKINEENGAQDLVCTCTSACMYTVDRDIFAGKIFRLLNFRII